MSYRKNPVFRREGFTLVEMLVAISILTVIATLSIAVIPVIQQRAKASQGGDRLQGWLLEAKQMALRDGAPRGVRLLIDPNTMYSTSALYIQQPDNFTGGVLIFDPPGGATSNPNKATIIGVALDGGLPVPPNYPPDLPQYPVQPGDYLQVQGGQAHVITHVYPPNPVTSTPGYVLTQTALWDTVNLPPAPAPTYQTTNYTIIRQPRPIAGEPVLYFPDDVAVDMTTNTAVSSRSIPDWTAAAITPSGLSYDIIFTPSGTLTGSIGNGNGKIILWVRDVTQDIDQPGEMPLICIFCRTGRTGGFQNNYQNGNPYLYVLDPRATGF
jgi:prepilin-type N-terminal cleavage/methylation domain-containing protein